MGNCMKTFFTLALTLFAGWHASAQVTVEVLQDQDQFLPAETMPVAVKITNLSGQSIHLGAAPNWLTFSVESLDGAIVIKKAEVPVQGEFDLESSQMAIKRVDLEPYFELNKMGRYKIIATLRIPEWTATMTSSPKICDIIHGAKIWDQEFGVSSGANTLPDVRKYTLEQASYRDTKNDSQMRLFIQVSAADGSHVYHTEKLGTLLGFSTPEAQIDRLSQLHVLWQSGAQAFSYRLISPEGKIITQETYDNFGRRPRLGVDQAGRIVVVGGTRRGAVTEMPTVKLPNELSAAQKTN